MAKYMFNWSQIAVRRLDNCVTKLRGNGFVVPCGVVIIVNRLRIVHVDDWTAPFQSMLVMY